MSSSILPRFVVIKSKDLGKYLKRVSKEESKKKGVPDTFLNFLGDDITSRYIKFEVVTAEKNGELVHIKCCHNNKYLSVDESDMSIEATALEPMEEDGPTSTMFKPIKQQQEEEYFQFLHPSIGLYVCISPPNEYYPAEDYGLCLGEISTFKYNVFKILDWESLVLFPKTVHVAFKVPGKDNHNYLCSSKIMDYQTLQYNIPKDIGDVRISNEISTSGDGYVRIKNISSGMYWMTSLTSWILSESRDNTGQDKDTLFWPVKLADNIIALRALKNSNFCQSVSSDVFFDCLNAHAPTITNEVKLEVVENIISKSISRVEFHKDEAKVYNLNVVQKGYASADNYENEENEVSLKFSYQKTSSSNFGSSHSLKLGSKTTLDVDFIPFIAEKGIEFSVDYSYKHHWEETTTTETLAEAIYTAKVPGKTKVKVTLVATQGMCDVPFSYTQRDILYDGKVLIRNMDDGVYKGVNMFNFEFRSEYETLDPTCNHKIHECTTSINQLIDLSIDRLNID
ncbi:hypothetical protein CsatA_002737 [Cannabis sativa]